MKEREKQKKIRKEKKEGRKGQGKEGNNKEEKCEGTGLKWYRLMKPDKQNK